MRAIGLLVCSLLLLGACNGGGEASSAADPSPTEKLASALIDTDDGPVLVWVEVADQPAERRAGLMHRTSLPRDHGMVFIYFELTNGGFWMKNTKIPLSIAFFDADGEIVRILDMDPCESDPCPLYSPGVTYTGALEVNQGAFDEWGVEVGDRITITQ